MKVQCTQCNQLLEVEPGYSGVVACSHCGTRLRVEGATLRKKAPRKSRRRKKSRDVPTLLVVCVIGILITGFIGVAVWVARSGNGSQPGPAIEVPTTHEAMARAFDPAYQQLSEFPAADYSQIRKLADSFTKTVWLHNRRYAIRVSEADKLELKSENGVTNRTAFVYYLAGGNEVQTSIVVFGAFRETDFSIVSGMQKLVKENQDRNYWKTISFKETQRAKTLDGDFCVLSYYTGIAKGVGQTYGCKILMKYGHYDMILGDVRSPRGHEDLLQGIAMVLTLRPN